MITQTPALAHLDGREKRGKDPLSISKSKGKTYDSRSPFNLTSCEAFSDPLGPNQPLQQQPPGPLPSGRQRLPLPLASQVHWNLTSTICPAVKKERLAGLGCAHGRACSGRMSPLSPAPNQPRSRAAPGVPAGRALGHCGREPSGRKHSAHGSKPELQRAERVQPESPRAPRVERGAWVPTG